MLTKTGWMELICSLCLAGLAGISEAGADATENLQQIISETKQFSYQINSEEAKRLAEDSSKELQIRLLRIKASSQAFKSGLRNFLPRVEVGINANDAVTVGTPDSRNRNATLTIRQSLFDGGRAVMHRKLSHIQLLLEKQACEKFRESILDETWKLFHRMLIFQEKERLQKEIYRVSLNELKIAQAERDAGVIRELDLIETRLEVRSLESELKATRIKLTELDYYLKRMLGLNPDSLLQLTGNIDTNYAGLQIGEAPEKYYGIALSRSLDVKNNRFAVQKRLEELKAAERRFIPSIDAEASLGVSGESFPLQEPGFSLSLRFSFPLRSFPVSTSLYAGSKGEVSVSRGFTADTGILTDIGYTVDKKTGLLNLEMERLREKNLLDSLLFDVKQARDIYNQKKESIRLKRDLLKLQKLKLNVLKEQLDIGEVKRNDFLKAQTRVLRDEISLLEDVLDLLEAERAFEQLLGLEPGELYRLSKNYENVKKL